MLKDSVAREVALSDDVSVFIVENAVLEEMLFDRNRIGLDMRRTCRGASELFVAHLADELEEERELAELVLLSKGLVYQLAESCETVLERNLPTNLIATRRKEVSGGDAVIETPYEWFGAGGDALLIGDTVASGATLCAALERYTAAHQLKRLYVLSYAGSAVGAVRIARWCQVNAIEVTFVYGLAAFGLAENGFDLSFVHPDTRTADRYVSRARQQFDGKPVSAVGWDFGSHVMAPTRYQELSWLEAAHWSLLGHESFEATLVPRDLDVAKRGTPLEQRAGVADEQ